MGEPILSQDEMDALLQGVQSGQVDTLMEPAITSGVRPYDLMNLNHYVTLSPILAIKVVSDPFVISFRVTLEKELRKEVSIPPPLVEMSKFDAFLETIPEGSSFNVVDVTPLTDTVLLIMTQDLVYLLLEHFYGGGKKGYARSVGGYTLIEKRFIRKILDLLLVDFQKAWAKVRVVTLSILRSDSTVRTMRILADKDWVVTARYKIAIGEGSEQEFFFCFPFADLEPLREKLYGGQGVESVYQTRAHQAALMRCVMEEGVATLSALVGSAALTVPEITKLEVGDIIMLNRGVNEDFELKIEGEPKFYGRAGKCKDKQAFQIRSLISSKP